MRYRLVSRVLRQSEKSVSAAAERSEKGSEAAAVMTQRQNAPQETEGEMYDRLERDAQRSWAEVQGNLRPLAGQGPPVVANDTVTYDYDGTEDQHTHILMYDAAMGGEQDQEQQSRSPQQQLRPPPFNPPKVEEEDLPTIREMWEEYTQQVGDTCKDKFEHWTADAFYDWILREYNGKGGITREAVTSCFNADFQGRRRLLRLLRETHRAAAL